MNSFLKHSGSAILTAALLLPSTQSLAAPPGTSASILPIKVANGTTEQAVKAKLTKEQALAIASKLFSESGLELSNTNFRSADQWRPFPEWSFSWVKKGKANESVELSINVGVNADTGELTSYSIYEQQMNKPSYASRIPYDEAQKTAERFLAQNIPSKATQTRLYTRDVPKPKTPLGGDVYYNFRFVREVDGVLFPDNSVEIIVNGTGKVTNFQLNWSDRILFNKPKTVISEEEANQHFQNDTTAKLAYFIPWERREQDTVQPYLAYNNPFDYFIDAGKGNPLSYSLVPKNNSSEPTRVSTKKLAPLYSGKALSQDAALKLAQKLFDLSSYQLRSANYSEKDYRGNRSIWNLDFENKDESQRPGYLFIAMDAQTGDIYTYNKEKGYPEKAGSANKEKTDAFKGKAIESIRKLSPLLADQMYLMDPTFNEPYPSQNPRVNFQFQRFINGIAAASGSAHVSFETNLGELLSYNVYFGKETYPAELPKHHPATDAIQAWLKETEVELIYVLAPLDPVETLKMKKGEEVKITDRKAHLVYRASITQADQQYIYDAITGEWRNQGTGKPIILHPPAPSDITSHPAEKELMLMYEYDAISLDDGKLMPDKSINRGEMIEMLMITLNQGRFYPEYMIGRKATFNDVANGSRYFASIEAAVDRGLLDRTQTTLKPDEPISREELADMLVRGLGYRKLADYSNMFQTDLTDIGSSKMRGAIVMITALGIMPTENSRFKPDGTVSRADAAVAFSRFLEKRSDLEDRRIEY